MQKSYKTPGVYIEEIPKLPPSIASVETAIPAFIGYTKKARHREDNDLLFEPKRISSMLEYENLFGTPEAEKALSVKIDTTQSPIDVQGLIGKPSNYLMYYSLQMFFINGGGPCYIVSVGDYSTGGVISGTDLTKGLDKVKKENEVTLIVFPDAINLSSAGDYYGLHKEALDQCKELQDRFTVMDVWIDRTKDPISPNEDIDALRNFGFGPTETSKYGAVYYPHIYSRLDYSYKTDQEDDDSLVSINVIGGGDLPDNLKDLKDQDNALYYRAKDAINRIEMLLPASSAVVGKYADTDSSRGVWKAPANIGIDNASRPEIKVTHKEQETLNVDFPA